MKILTYNVNGIRAAINKGFLEWLKATQADAVCLQEIKAEITQIDHRWLEDLGYHVSWFSAQKKGYSGVAILSKEIPKNVTYGCGLDIYDNEGRIIRADFETFSLMSAYLPSGTSGDVRQEFKMQFLVDFQDYISDIVRTKPQLIIAGDFNICHHEIDIHNPRANANSTGFLPEERQWISGFLNDGFIDTFRYFNSEPHHYTWWSYRTGARGKNLGWRIDYQLASLAMQNRLKRCMILPEAKHSDHCPVLLEID